MSMSSCKNKLNQLNQLISKALRHHNKICADVSIPLPLRLLNMKMSIHLKSSLTLLLMSLLSATPAAAAVCSAESGKSRVALLELYTSEGCDSCPPTDQWFSALPKRGYTPQRVLALSFHVDYWNYLGWKDPFAQARFSERQREANRRINSRVVYTPQLMLNGADYRRGGFGDDLGQRVSAGNGQAPGAQISLTVTTDSNQAKLNAKVVRNGTTSAAQAFVAVYENNLATDVPAGENRGKRLLHDFVVRELYGPFALNANTPLLIEQSISKDRGWKAADLNLAVFVQDSATGTALQALNLPWCTSG